jgi:hypothetical protein
LKYQGLAVPNLYVESGIEHVALLLQETHGLTQTGKLLIMSLEAMKVEIGVGGSVLTQSFSRYGSLATRSWVKHTWQFLAENNMTVEDQVGDLPLRRQGDVYLTEAFTRHGIKGARLQQLNACRLFLQVDTLSDITTADGRYITWYAQHGIRDDTRSTSHKWPSQSDPGPRIWTEWQRTLAIVFCGGYLTHGLLTPLGPFINTGDDWQWWYSLQEERIYKKEPEGWCFYFVQ